MLLLAGLLVSLTSCSRKEVRLEFDLDDQTSTPCRVIYFEEGRQGGVFRENVADVRNGKGRFRIPAYYPTLMFLYSTSGTTPAQVIYADPGDEIKITGAGTDFSKWKVDGNATSRLLSEWHAENAPLLLRRDKGNIDKAVAKFVDAHTDSKAAAILLYLYFDRRNDEAEFLKLEKKLNKDITGDKDLMRALALADYMTGGAPIPNYPAEIIKTGESGYADTVRLDKGKGKLMIFRGSSNISNALPIDSIRQFMTRNKQVEVVEFFYEADSMAWRRKISADTLPGMRRLWLPLGAADTMAIAMGVKRIPYIIAIDTLRKELYRGDSWTEATKALQDK